MKRAKGDLFCFRCSDALCINQQDNDERCAQVQVMKDIYSQAKETIGWLGEATPHTAPAIEFAGLLNSFMDEVLDPASQHYRDAMEMLGHGASMNAVVTTSIEKVIGWRHPGWEALARMFDNKWFSRIWVVQELVLSRHFVFQWGQEQITGQLVLGFFRKIWPYKGIVTQFVQFSSGHQAEALINGTNSLKQPTIAIDLLIIIFSVHESTDPRDKIYALLSLVKNASSYGLIPDYNVSTNTLVEMTTRAILEDVGSLGFDFLNFFGRDPSKAVGLPSWCSNFILTDNGPSSSDLQGFHFKTTADTKAHLRWHEDEELTLLTLHGRIVDTISNLSQQTESLYAIIPRDPTEILQYLNSAADQLDACKRLAQAAALRPNSKTDMSRYWRTLVGDFDENWEKVGDGHTQYFEAFEEYQQYMRKASTLDELTSSLTDWSELKRRRVEEYARCVGRKGSGKQFAATISGRLGWLPPWAQEGDRVAVIYGSTVPWVIRSAGRNRWKRLGTCYIEGIMYGETMEDPEYQTEDMTFC